MRVEAIYDNGKLQFTEEPPLRHTRFKVMVEIPDKELAHHQVQPAQQTDFRNEANLKSASLNTRLAVIMGKAYRERPAVSKEEDRKDYLELMVERYTHG